MEQGFISSLADDDFNNISSSLLQNVLSIVPSGIQLLRALRNKDNEIIDFEYVLLNQSPVNNARIGKTFLTENPKKTELFEHLVKEVNNEPINGSADPFTMNDKASWLHIRYKKFGDGVLLSIEDITLKKTLNERSLENQHLLQQIADTNHELATANLELQTFSSIAANDYKDTLKHLYTSLEYITTAEAPNLSHTGRANIRRSQAAIQKMKLLTEDIIVYSAIQNLDGKETLVDLMEIFESIKKNYDKRIKEEDIHIDCSNLPVVKGHQQLLSLLFHHLIDNALKFNRTGRKTTVHVNCTQQEGNGITNPAAIKGKKYEVVSIIDNGHGFHPEQGEDIFKMFYRVPGTKNQKGSGMGLAICKKIMDIHKGFITAESIPDDGASFYCYFPV